MIKITKMIAMVPAGPINCHMISSSNGVQMFKPFNTFKPFQSFKSLNADYGRPLLQSSVVCSASPANICWARMRAAT
jgi:hypothetical protein